MGNANKTFRIKANIGQDTYIPVQLDSEYDVLEILSLKIEQKGEYRYHTSDYGVLVGRVLANNGFGVPNARLSLFIPKDENSTAVENELYPYSTVGSKNKNGVRYNLLPSVQKNDCHQAVGTFPSKRLLLDDNSTLEVFDKYYLFTTRTNDAGDYMFYGVPTGSYILHMDLDISDCGKLSQRPRDFVYKGYTIEQFENPNQFKTDTELSALSQIFTQDIAVEIKSFWGDKSEKNQIGVTRADIDVAFKFEPTCVFMGSIVTDSPNDGISKKCVPSNRMGEMGDLVTGSGTIEIIRKKIDNTVEELQIKGKQLINGNGVWCFQIPMNLDYVMTDEYGNMVPTDNPEKGIPTRCEVRFRISLDENGSDSQKYHRGKVLVPHNPMTKYEEDYEFGSNTKDNSFKSLMWNNVYSIKSFVPRFQKSRNVKTDKFTGIKNINNHGSNNPIPYNNIRIKLPFTFWITCNIVKLIIRIVQIINVLKVGLMSVIGNLGFVKPYSYISNEFCPDLENWYFAPGMHVNAPKNDGKDKSCKKWQHESACLTFKAIADELSEGTEYDDTSNVIMYEYKEDDTSPFYGGKEYISAYEYEQLSKNDKKKFEEVEIGTANNLQQDNMSTDLKNQLNNRDARIKLTNNVDYLMQCVEMSLAQEYGVIKFDFYNDWLNGTVYLPRWARQVKYKRKRKNGTRVIVEKVKGCINDYTQTKLSRRYVQQCSVTYKKNNEGNFIITSPHGCGSDDKLKCHKKQGMDYIEIFGEKSGIVQEQETMLKDNVYYLKPSEFRFGDSKRGVPLYATDIIMLGSLSDCNQYGLPTTFESLVSTTYQLPPNMAATNVDSDSYFYDIKSSEDGKEPPTVNDINNWSCGNKCNKGGDRSVQRVLEGVEPIIPDTRTIIDSMEEYEGIGDDVIFEYEDFFPITEMSGIEWGYTGPAQSNGEIANNKIYAPGGHFMGLSCSNAETNVRSCVNLKRACEIGTTLSERLEIPMGSDKNDNTTFLFVSPNGLISKDQIYDVSFRSAFATMNFNSLKTVINPVTSFKEYDFKFMLPDSFDGSFSEKIEKLQNNPNATNRFTQKINMEYDSVMEDKKDEFQIESGFTITRSLETVSKDYVTFRGIDFLKNEGGGSKSMPSYLNSFYFYFGLINGQTALDEFKKQYFASCNRTTILGKDGYFVYSVKDNDITKFTYDIEVSVSGITSPFNWRLERMDNSEEMEGVNGYDYFITGATTDNDFEISEVNMGRYYLSITGDGATIKNEVNVGIGTFDIDVKEGNIVNYFKSCDNVGDNFGKEYNTNGGYIESTFTLTPDNINGVTYSIEIAKEGGNETIKKWIKSSWEKYYDGSKLWVYGPGNYYIKVVALNGTQITGSFIYATFYVKDGSALKEIKLGDLRYKDFQDIPYSFEPYNVNTLTGFTYYKNTVNPKILGQSFNLNVFYDTDDSTKVDSIYGGMAEYNMGINYMVQTNDNVSKPYYLNFRNIVVPVNYYDINNKRRSGFYFTAREHNSSVFATDYAVGEFKDGKFDNFDAISYGEEEYYYCEGKGVEGMVLMSADGKILSDVKVSTGSEYTLVKMVKLPVIVYPFKTDIVFVVNDSDKESFRWYSPKAQCFLEHLNTDDTLQAIEFNDYEIVVTENNAGYEYDGGLEKIIFDVCLNNFGKAIKYRNENDGVVFIINDTDAAYNDNIKYYIVYGDIEGINGNYYISGKDFDNNLDINKFIDNNNDTMLLQPEYARPYSTYKCGYDEIPEETPIRFYGVYTNETGSNDADDLKNNYSRIAVVNTYGGGFMKYAEVSSSLSFKNPYREFTVPSEVNPGLTDVNKLKKLKVKLMSQAERNIIIECTEETQYMEGIIYEYKAYSGKGVPSEKISLDSLNVLFLSQDDYDNGSYAVHINYDDVDLEWELTDKAVTNNETFNIGNYKLMVAAYDENDNLLTKVEYQSNNATLVLSGDDLKNLSYFQWEIENSDDVENTEPEEGGGVIIGGNGTNYKMRIEIRAEDVDPDGAKLENHTKYVYFECKDKIASGDTLYISVEYKGFYHPEVYTNISFDEHNTVYGLLLQEPDNNELNYNFYDWYLVSETTESTDNNTYQVTLENGDVN